MVYIILGKGFEPMEAVAPCDILRRGGADVRFAGIGGTLIEGSHGIRTENELICRELEHNEYGQFMGFETITCVPIDLDAVIPEEMTARQRGWLNEYHAFVREKLLPLMADDAEREWLRQATRAI